LFLFQKNKRFFTYARMLALLSHLVSNIGQWRFGLDEKPSECGAGRGTGSA
jgi:hypothetical protein